MSKVHRMLTVAAWAAEMSISKQAGYNAVRRCGIPLAGGLVDADVATILYRQRTQYRVNTARMAKAHRPAEPKTLTPADFMELAQDIADIMEDAPHLIPEGMPHLVAALRGLAATDEDMLAQVLLPPAVHAALEMHLTEPEA